MSNETQTIGETGIYDAKVLGIPKLLLLGLQHTFAMFGATVLVPLLTGLDVSTTLFMAGVGTLLFHLVTKRKVPAFLGSSFAFLGGFAAVAPLLKNAKGDAVVPNVEMLPYACGGVAIAGLIYLVLSLFIKLFGINKVMRYFPPVVTGPIIISIGLILAPTAVENCATNWPVALVALAVIIICNIWGKGMVKIIPIILGVVASYLVALALGAVNFDALKDAAIVSLPLNPSMFAKFSVSAILTIAPIAIASMMEHIGDISAISATADRNFIAEPGLHRTLLGDGLATTVAGLFGGPANTTYGENTGVLALTKVYDPLVMEIAAVFAIILSFFP
ncbi:MAG: uracil-xanthine permease, partial [Lachnospiraceae bacterium]|nr:uracil-xanthine permease [Lachnospiraceae bacterium]